MKLINQAKKMPDSPGVYLFIDKSGRVLYVGRATNLRRRVLNYFQKKADPRINEMVDLAYKIKRIKTDTILESVILEANLIKKYWPKYNVKEKDDRSFIYIVIPKDDYPKPIIVRARELQKFSSGSAKIFGPYQSLSLIKNALKIIRRIFPYSLCKPIPAQGGQAGNPCFDYQIGMCPGTCVGKISKKDYQKNIKSIIAVLSGKKFQSDPRFKHIQDVALISQEELPGSKFIRIEGYDISHLTGKETFGSMVVFTNGKADKSQYRLFKIKTAPKNDDLRALEEVVLRRLKHREWQCPDLILIDGGKPQVNTIYKVLQNQHLKIPLLGISKLAGDRLVFPKSTKKSIKELIGFSKTILLQVRDEAHRFALKFSRRQRKIK